MFEGKHVAKSFCTLPTVLEPYRGVDGCQYWSDRIILRDFNTFQPWSINIVGWVLVNIVDIYIGRYLAKISFVGIDH